MVSDSPGSGFGPAGLLTSGVKGLQGLTRVGGCLENWAAATGARTVLIAAPRSFCAGVCRAIDITEQALAQFGPPLYVRREIVHNKHVVDSFRDRGVVFVRELSEVPQGRAVVLAAHGVSPAVRAEAQTRGMETIDATCPLVARLHAKARMLVDQGHFVVFIGKKGHDETEGVVGEAPDSIVVVEDQADIDRLDEGRFPSLRCALPHGHAHRHAHPDHPGAARSGRARRRPARTLPPPDRFPRPPTSATPPGTGRRPSGGWRPSATGSW